VTEGQRISVVTDTAAPPVRELVQSLLDAADGSIAAIVLYGSQLLRASPNADSAWDLVVIVDRYAPFHTALSRHGLMLRPPWMLNTMGHILPPSITALIPPGGTAIGKCAIVSVDHFQKAVAPRSPDHFLKGRMVQQVALVWSRDDETAATVDKMLREARRDVLAWAGPWLGEPFDARSVPRQMLRVSYGGELRPEAGGRADEIYEAQSAWLEAAYSEVLEDAVRDGTLVRAQGGGDEPGGYSFAQPLGRWAGVRVRLYFAWSKVRATLRWGKHVVTFNDWLGYLLRKVERRTGETVELTVLERRLPLIFLWPRTFHFFLSGKHRKRIETADDP